MVDAGIKLDIYQLGEGTIITAISLVEMDTNLQ